MENGSYSSSSEASSVSSITPVDDVEVRKLKDLVKKLEKQNEHLRHRTGKLSSTTSKISKHKTEKIVAAGDAPNHQRVLTTINGFINDSDDIKELDENDPLYKSVIYGDELTWLFTLPKPPNIEVDDKKYSSPIDWLNEEIENPSTPQLASARRSILFKIGIPISDSSPSPDLERLTRNVEKRLLFNADDYKLEDPTDVKVVARLQQEELSRDNVSVVQTTQSSDGFSTNNHRRRNSREEQSPRSSPGQFTQHLPLPSQTMTTDHGLLPVNNDIDPAGVRGRRSLTPTKYENPQSISKGLSPRNKSPARPRQSKSPSRRSLPSPRTNSSTSIRTSSPTRQSLPSDINKTTHSKSINLNTSPQQQPSIRSSLVAPGRISRLQHKSSLPNPTGSSGNPSGSRSLVGPRAPSPMTTQRRSLPRPSQTSTNLRYSSKLSTGSSRLASMAQATKNPAASPQVEDVWGDDEVY